MFEKIYKIIGSALYSTFVEPVYGVIMGQDGMRMLMAFMFVVSGIMAVLRPDMAVRYMLLYLSSVVFCSILNVWIADPFVIMCSRAVELGWLLYFIPSGMMALSGLFMPGYASSVFVFAGVCYIISALFRSVINYRAGEKKEDPGQKQRRKREDAKGGGACVDMDFSSVFIGMPFSEAKKKYASLMKKYHPDNGGDMRMAQEINLAFQKYRGCM